MFSVETTHLYRAFGFNVYSSISLPELPSLTEKSRDAADIYVGIKDLSKLRHEISPIGDRFIVADHRVVFEIPEVALFCIENGERITVSPCKDYDEDMIRLFVLGTCMGVVLMQKKKYPLHGSAVVVKGKAYAFIGDSGAGKSTLASAFLKQGFQLVSDDVIAVSLSDHNKYPVITPSYPQQKLWQESLSYFGMQADTYRSVYGRQTKYCIPVVSQYYTEPLPLAGIFELNKSEDEDIKPMPLQGLERLHCLFRHTYRNFLLSSLGLLEWHFNTSIEISKHIIAYRIERPTRGFSVRSLSSHILKIIEREEG